MKRFKEKKLESLFIIIAILIVMSIICVFIATTNKNEGYEEEEYLGWMEGVVPNDYMNVNNFADNICGKTYYTSLFKIEGKKLYDYRDNLIGEKMFSIIPVTYSDCNVQLMFVSNTDGDLYYINNSKESSLKQYELVKLEDVTEIVRIDIDSDNRIIAYDKEDKETEITDILKEVVDLENISTK